MTPEFPEPFAQHYDCLLKRMKLHGMQPKTIALYSHGVRRAGAYFAYQIDALSRAQLTDYFVHVVELRPFPNQELQSIKPRSGLTLSATWVPNHPKSRGP